MRRRERMVERIVTAGLLGVLAALAVWRFGPLTETHLAPTARAAHAAADPFQVIAVWEDGARPRLESIVLPRGLIAERAAAGRLFSTLEALPGLPFAAEPYLVFRWHDAALVTESIQPRAVEDANRCLLAIAAGTVSRLGGPLTAAVTLRHQLPSQPLCG